tara:strand:+ start:839 stop:1078 length:240 start_codon:yes stop_codon:yes gene_type:complete
MKITEDKQQQKPPVVLGDIADGQCFIYHARASDSTQAAVRVRVGDRMVLCIHLESGDVMTLDRSNYVTPITITELRYKV